MIVTLSTFFFFSLLCLFFFSFFFFFFNDTATTEIYTLSLHDALPILLYFTRSFKNLRRPTTRSTSFSSSSMRFCICRSEEHTSELQSRPHLVCRLLLEKKKKNKKNE